jgi:predicted metal-dependent peptidase
MSKQLTPEQRLTRSHIQLMRSPQFALLSGIIMLGKSSIEDNLPTAATNGRDKFYGRAFVDDCNEKQLNFAVVHENFHVMLRQLSLWDVLYRTNAQVANMACDYVINQMIVDLDPHGELIELPNFKICLAEKYRGWDTKRVFDDLMQNPPPPSASGGDGEGDGGFDSHSWGEANSMSDEEKKELSKAVDQAIRQGSILAGKLGGKDARAVGALPDPKVDWREQLRDFITSVTSGRDTTTWRRPNRRWLAQDAYMPSPYSESIGEIVVGVDTSGSIDQKQIAEFLAEIKSITQTNTPDRLHLLYWDTEIAGAEVYESGMYEGLENSTKPAGGGGTDPACVKRYVDNMGSRPELVLMLSDGYIFGEYPDFNAPTMWAMTTDKVAPNATNIRLN